jgi:large subunit ribosomal protein L17
MAVIELVESLTVAQEAVGEGERARATRFRRPRKGAEGAPAADGALTEEAADDADAGVDAAVEDSTAPGDAVPGEGDTEGAPEQVEEPAAPVPTEGDTEASETQSSATAPDVAPEGGDQPAEDVTSEQTAEASDKSQAEGDEEPQT